MRSIDWMTSYCDLCMLSDGSALFQNLDKKWSSVFLDKEPGFYLTDMTKISKCTCLFLRSMISNCEGPLAA